MEVNVGKHREGMVDTLVRNGRFASASDVVEEGLRLVEEQEKKLDWLRAKIQGAIDRGGSHTDDEVDAHLDEIERRLEAEGR